MKRPPQVVILFLRSATLLFLCATSALSQIRQLNPVFFQSDQPAYPGLRFETPQPLPKTPNNSGQPTFFRPEETPQRFNGTLYSFVTLDANLDTYPHSRTDFDDLLKSFVIDSK